MFLNYRIELCRRCYFKRTGQCPHSDLYVQNRGYLPLKQGGECPRYLAVPWLPHLP